MTRFLCLCLAVGALLLAGAGGEARAQTQGPRPATPNAAAAAPKAAAAPVTAVAPKVAADADSYILGPQDVIELEVLGRSDFKVHTAIGSDGAIQTPYLGTVMAAKKTINQLRADIVKALVDGKYFTNPVLSVQIVNYASRYVTVLGEVGGNSLVSIDRPYRVSEILARVGGVKDDAADYLVLTPADGPQRNIAISTLATGGASQDPFVSPGDKIYVPKGDVFYISGEVKSPGAYTLLTDMTLRMAIGRGGGLTDLGSDRGVKVTHPDGKVDHPGMNDKIKAGDVILVGQRLF